MKKIVKYTLISLGLLGTATAISQSVAPRVTKGDRVSNVEAPRNFVYEPIPDAARSAIPQGIVQTANVSVTRNDVSPLTSPADFKLGSASATWTADWLAAPIEAGMAGRNCEVRAVVQDFPVAIKIQAMQGANILGQLTLPASSSAQPVSINFPCGTTLTGYKVRVTGSGAVAASPAPRISSVYLGLATNMANVAQAEDVGGIEFTNNTWDITQTSYVADYAANGSNGTAYGNCTAPSTAVPQMTCTLKPGQYQILGAYLAEPQTISTVQGCRIYDGTNTIAENTHPSFQAGTAAYTGRTAPFVGRVSYTTSQTVTFKIQCYASAGIAKLTANSSIGNRLVMRVYRFPSSSELVVTPERQNVFGGVTYSRTADSIAIGGGVVAPTGYIVASDSAWNTGKAYYGKCEATDIDANRIGCKIPNLPVGSYKITATGLLYETNVGGQVICSYALTESTTGNTFAYTSNKYASTSGGVIYGGRTITGIFQNTSVANRNFLLSMNKTYDDAAGSVGTCQAFVSNAGGDISNFTITIEPLDQPSNSALYVEGPVKAAATGAAIPAGYVGEVKQANLASACPGAGFNAGASVSITPGVWRITGTFTFEGNTFNDLLVFISPQSGTSQTWRNSYFNDSWNSLPQITSASKLSMTTPPLLVRYDGTTMYRFQNNTWTDAFASATGQLWAKLYYSANCVGAYTSILAERVN